MKTLQDNYAKVSGFHASYFKYDEYITENTFRCVSDGMHLGAEPWHLRRVCSANLESSV
jgi:hypothetical protein